MAATKEKLIILDQIKRGIQKEVEVKKQAIIKEIGEGLTKILDATIRNSDALDQTLENYFSKLRVSLTAPGKPKSKDSAPITIEDLADDSAEGNKGAEDGGNKNELSSDKTNESEKIGTDSESKSDEMSGGKDKESPSTEETTKDKDGSTTKTSPKKEPQSINKSDKPADILKPSKLSDKPDDKDKSNDKKESNESVYDAATGKYGVWIDGEFVIDANKRHEDDPNAIVKQEIKEEPGLMEDLPMDYMDDPGMMGMMDMNNNMLPVFKDEDFPDMNYPLDPSLMADGGFGMGAGAGDFGSNFNMHMPNDFGSLGGASAGNLHGPSKTTEYGTGTAKSGGLKLAGFATESQFGASKPKPFGQGFGHTPANNMSHSRPLLAPAKPLGVGMGKQTEIGINNNDLPPMGIEPMTTGKVQRPDLVNQVVSTFAQTHEVTHPNDMNDSIRKNWVVYVGTVEGGDKYKCRDCPYTSPGKGNIVLHVKRVHFKIKRDQCDFCPFSASTKQELVGHINTTHQRMVNSDYEFTCTQCPYTTKFRQSLNGHVKYTHQKFVNYGCDKCRFFTYQEEKLDEHITQNHGHDNPLSCMNCTYVTGKQRFLQRHVAACVVRT